MSMGIKNKCAEKYTMLLRVYLLLLAFVALCAGGVMAAERIRAGALVMLCVCALLCAGAVTVPMRSRRVSYTRAGGCLKIERGLLVRRTLILNRSDVHYSEISGGPVARRMGLCTVTFFTGGGNVRLRGIRTEDGRRLHFLFGGEAAE